METGGAIGRLSTEGFSDYCNRGWSSAGEPSLGVTPSSPVCFETTKTVDPSLQRTKPRSSGGQVIQRVYALRVSLCRRVCVCTLSLSLSVALTLVLIHPLTSSPALICSVKRELYPNSTGCRIHSRSRTARSRSFATFTSSTHSHTSPTTATYERYL